ncbi:MAG: hypothetical protein ACI9FR_001571 [Cryomorphaceae bacterium]|jgi:hypothetical protein
MRLNLLTIAFIVAGTIHTMPVIGVFGSDRIKALYDLQVTDPNLLLLLQHRAILFGVVAVILFAAVFNPAYHSLAIGLGTLSMLTFIAFAYFGSGISASLVKVAWVDLLLWVAVALQ